MIPLLVILEVYDILCEFDEAPLVSKETFFSLCSKGLIFNYSFDCNHCVFSCHKPFICSVALLQSEKMDENKFEELNDRLTYLSNKCQRTLAFW